MMEGQRSANRSDSIGGDRIGAHNPYSGRDYSAQYSVLEIRRDPVILRTPKEQLIKVSWYFVGGEVNMVSPSRAVGPWQDPPNQNTTGALTIVKTVDFHSGFLALS
jgi:hypothetical protein